MSPVQIVEMGSLFVLSLFVVLEVRGGSWRQTLPLGLVLMLAAWVGEDTCIRLYRFYAYSPWWHAMIDRMPLMVALIWPFVIVSDYRVVEGALGAGHRALPFLTGALVCYDAALMEVVSVRAGLWAWLDTGFFDVPVIGVLGWGFFTASSLWLWQRLDGWSRAWMVLLAPLLTHLLLLATWWGGVRWVLRGPFSSSQTVTAAIVISAVLAAGVVWRRIKIPFEIMMPRIVAASLFFWLLYRYGSDDRALVLYVLTFVPPYVLATRMPGAAGRLAPGAAGS